MDCRFCGSPVDSGRVEIGYSHCMADACVNRWRAERLNEYALHLVPKQGFSILPKSETYSGRSSGR